MTFRSNILALAISAAVFAVCCIVMFKFGQQMNSKVLVYPFVAVWGLERTCLAAVCRSSDKDGVVGSLRLIDLP